ncbi:MAG TPA: dienelactone hydrolase family protein [Rhizomicrobium sp.]|jgi:dienelactone hydrolase
METREIAYQIDGRTFSGYLADGSKGRKVPGILVAYEAGGMTEHPKERARMLAEAGYVAFAMDLFGEAIRDMGHAMGFISQLTGDLPMFRRRVNAALDVLKAQANVDPKRTAAIGFCFGGTTVLELARSGADVGCVVGFHSGLATTAPQDAKNIKAKVLVLIGDHDPIIPHEQRDAFVKEMREGGVDWQMVVYGRAGHSFTNPEVDAHNIAGFKYDPPTDKRAWAAMQNLFDEVLGPV